MGVYGEGLGGKPHLRNFTFQKLVTDIKEDAAPVKLPVPADKWADFWKHGEWNELKASIVGNPPKVTTYIKGIKFMEYTDTEKRLPDSGGIALQVHGGGDFTKEKSTIRAKIIFHFDRNFKVTIFFIGDNDAAITWNILASNDCAINNLPFAAWFILTRSAVPGFRTYMPTLHGFSIKNVDPLSFFFFLGRRKGLMQKVWKMPAMQ